MWISFIHPSLISRVHEFMCWVEVWDPENFILLLKASCGLSPVLDKACAKRTSFYFRRILIHTWIVLAVLDPEMGGKSVQDVVKSAHKSLVPPAF